MTKTKRFIIFLAIATIFFSCSTSTEKSEDASDYKQLDTIINFAGSWLIEDYYNSILKHKSPKTAQDGAEFIIIPNKTLQQTIMLYGFHEGGPFLKILKNKNAYEVWEVQEDSLINKHYDIKILSDTKIQLGKKRFVKISSAVAENFKILENILFQGIYISEKGNNVEFKPDGTVTGLENISYYEPIIDYVDAGMQIDQIGLGKSDTEIEWFGFKFKDDTLEIYELQCLTFDSTMNSCVEVDYGKLSHKLWRK